MTSVKMVLVKKEGVLGYIVREYDNERFEGARIRYYYDGLSYDVYLELHEYIEKFIGEIDE